MGNKRCFIVQNHDSVIPSLHVFDIEKTRETLDFAVGITGELGRESKEIAGKFIDGDLSLFEKKSGLLECITLRGQKERVHIYLGHHGADG